MSNSTLESLSSAFASANREPLTTIFTPSTSCLSETNSRELPNYTYRLGRNVHHDKSFHQSFLLGGGSCVLLDDDCYNRWIQEVE
jgi:hypothetical protein